MTSLRFRYRLYCAIKWFFLIVLHVLAAPILVPLILICGPRRYRRGMQKKALERDVDTLLREQRAVGGN